MSLVIDLGTKLWTLDYMTWEDRCKLLRIAEDILLHGDTSHIDDPVIEEWLRRISPHPSTQMLVYVTSLPQYMLLTVVYYDMVQKMKES